MKGQTDRHMDRQTDESDLIGGCSTDIEPPIQINIKYIQKQQDKNDFYDPYLDDLLMTGRVSIQQNMLANTGSNFFPSKPCLPHFQSKTDTNQTIN